ncbi:MAG: helicase-related protein [Micropruina sp.]|uniref:DEAD/DEAH box helicase n=1 Tax=Micropruina sp. TaxID=2737536 RepID=UPI0039E2EAA7
MLIDDTARNSQIVDDVAESLRRGRNCVVLTRRVKHVDTLATALAERGFRALRLQGGMAVAERRAVIDELSDTKAGDGVLVIGTTPFMGEGFDAPALDTLFLAGPIAFDGHLVQCAGRIIRPFPGKEVAEVHDYHDTQAPILAASLRRRLPGYRSLGFCRPDGTAV